MMKNWSKQFSAGGKWSGKIAKGKKIKFTALEDGANTSLLLYNAHDLTERYSMPDTFKAQHTSHLTKGNVLMSDNGHVLASMIEDSVGWHDSISGYTTRVLTNQKYGLTNYQESHNNWFRSGEENLLVELVRNGLDARDLVPVVNIFTKVFCDSIGNMHFSEKHSLKGDTVTLRTEMDILLILSNTPNPLDTSSKYPAAPVKLEVSSAQAITPDDYCVNYCNENLRAFQNTWEYYSLIENKN